MSHTASMAIRPLICGFRLTAPEDPNPRPAAQEVSGYELTDVRGAPDRPGLELVFIARKSATTS